MSQLIGDLPKVNHSFQHNKFNDKDINFISNKISILEKDIFFKLSISRNMNISFNDFINHEYSTLSEIREKYKNERRESDLDVE